MISVRISSDCIVSGPDVVDAEITVQNRIWRFDYCNHTGPLWLKGNGEPRKCQNPNKAVWLAFEEWLGKWEEGE